MLEAIRAAPPAGCAGATLSGSGPDGDRVGDGPQTPARPSSQARFPDHEVLALDGRATRRAVSYVLVDVRPRAAYDAGHIPGAVHLDPESDLSAIGADPAVGGRHPLPDDGRARGVFARAGVEPALVRARRSTTAPAGRRAAGGCCVTSGTTAPATFDLRAYVGPLDDRRRRAGSAASFRARPRDDDTITAEEILARLDDP